MKIPSVLLCLFSLLFITDAGATALMQWERLPLPVALHVGHERVVMVNKNVRVGYPAGLDGKLRIQSSGGTVYLKASAPFPDARLQLKDMDSGALILLDVSASDGEALEPVELHYDNAVYGNDATAHPAQEPDDTPPTTALPLAPAPVALTRYAAQMLYAPLRTVEPLAGVREVSPRLPDSITTLLPGAPVSASPLGAWQLAGDTVTAIRLQNQGAQRVTLDPRSLQGDFYAATFQHPWLGASGSPEDTTVVYLVTRGVQADRAILPEPQNTEKR
ncbi:TIGR03749 family integrating conjugative element protein [Lelliottia wanjuensis]|uniref:TIGR03749 family integrating conjugative element protein n=1 Tax=Lelliottia wanjuensis TaxID=3050585 RepID=A0AAP4FRI7_9ENTR|nr:MULTISPECIES: TIGR03749 family integrating conjugative element protein [unclassified Lelliottia]MDK9361941.1 TIGR03749 family integrating conjugative element protein [Lelliottia sp. V106_12]MDK9584334.1 TIGR03749 family integrating conjugative element protein [Lelliottia sp. V86_10]MDK9617341.1 TIGR03749 family integrating conjugative element protein [Lelliottia sp. V106_9]